LRKKCGIETQGPPESGGQHDRDEVEIVRGEVPNPHDCKASLGTSARATLSGRAALLTQEGVAFLHYPRFCSKPVERDCFPASASTIGLLLTGLSRFVAKHSSIQIMKPTTTSGLIAMSMDNPALEIEDFERFVELYRARVFRFVYSSVRDLDLAETLTQDCFWNAYRHRNAFRGDCSVNTWLIKIAINLIRDQARRRRFQFWKKTEYVAGEEMRKWPDSSLSPEQRAVVNDQVRAVWEATGALSERQRTVFFLRYVEDLNTSEIAQATGLTESTVSAHLIRAVRGIRKQLGRLT
jgi:RNA polymerase sigma-70 factor (ECF subfamily)